MKEFGKALAFQLYVGSTVAVAAYFAYAGVKLAESTFGPVKVKEEK